jgi:hypothetical protein
MSRVAVTGWDCAPPALVFERWREQLPNLQALMARACWGTLRSCDPPIAVPADPGRHVRPSGGACRGLSRRGSLMRFLDPNKFSSEKRGDHE